MLLRIAALLCAASCVSSLRPPVSSRRAVLGSVGLAATALNAPAASAKAKRADEYEPIPNKAEKYASGFVRKKTSAELKKELLDDVFDPYELAYNKKDYAALTKLFTPDAKIVDGTDKKVSLVTTSGAEYGPYVSKGPGYTNARVLPVSIVPESETDGVTVKTVHVQYDFKHADGNFRCYRRVVMTADGWKSDRELFPLDSPKAYAKLMPKRDAFGHLYMQLG